MIGDSLRFKTAVALVLLGLLTLLAGIGQKTIWAPAETVTATASSDSAAVPLTVIDQKLRTHGGGTVKINVKGEGSFMLATGRPDDVSAWVGKTAHNTVTGVSEDSKSLQVAHTDGEEKSPSPAGSDLWVSTEKASGDLNYTWNAPADGEWSLLLASDGTKPAPSSISMTFDNDTSTPWAVPFMVLGALILLAGIALLVFRPRGRKDRLTGGAGGRETSDAAAGGSASEESGATTGSTKVKRVNDLHGMGVAKGSLMLAALTATAVAGSGVAAQASTTPAPSPSASTSAPAEQSSKQEAPVLLDAQLRRILEQVASTVDAGDAAKDVEKLKPRVGGTELEIREKNYKIRSQVGAYGARLPVRATKLLTAAVQGKSDWPRSVLAVTQGEGNAVPELLTLVQPSPRENYKLVLTSPLQPGTTLPAIGAGTSEALAPGDKSGLMYSGDEALAALGDRLTKNDSTFKDKLVEAQPSLYIDDVHAYQAGLLEKASHLNWTFTHKMDPKQTVVFRTSDGGALVLSRLDATFDGTPKGSDDLTLADDAAVLAGGKTTTSGVVLNFAESVAVYVPPAGSKDPMKLVAADRGLVAASFK
jgi:hypothetical protein